MLTTREADLLGDMADVCNRLSQRSTTLSTEANVATDDNDLVLSRKLIERAKGINEAVNEMMALVSRRAKA